ncbi:MAG: 50S ribosomal protein L24 [Chthoniobacteraceae bacterium]
MKTNKRSFHVRRGDLVQVISGNHKGSRGKILQVITKKAQIIIEGVRLIKKHVRRSQEHPNGGIVEREGPIHVSNVKLIERPEVKTPARSKPR